MAFPSYKEIDLPLLLYVSQQGGEVLPKDCYDHLAKFFELSEQEISVPLSEVSATDRSEPKWNNMVQWARQRLVGLGYLLNAEQSGWGKWKITEAGAQKANSLANKADITYPDDIGDVYFEGAKKQINVNKYERSRAARDKCIDHYGPLCSVCEFDFAKFYGDIGKDFIHVHHMVPISDIGSTYELDPVEDLRPICPNCHAMIHRSNPCISIADLKKLILENGARTKT